MKKLALIVSLTGLLAGCTINDNIDAAKSQVSQVADEIMSQAHSTPKYDRFIFSDKFYVPPLTEKEINLPDWYFHNVNITGVQLPFEQIVTSLIRGQAVTPKYVELSDEDKLSPISFTFENKPLGEALETLAKTAGYAFHIEGNAALFNKFEERSFSVASLPGKFNSQIGNDGELELGGSNSSSTSASTTASMDAGNRQYSSLTIEERSILEELKKAIEIIKSKDGKVEISESTMSIFVKDTPSALDAITKIIDSFNESLTRSINLDIVLLDVVYSSNMRESFDPNLIASLFDGNVSISASNGGLLGGGSVPTASEIEIGIVGGDFDGTQLLLDAIEKHAQVSRKIPISISLSNGTMSKIMSVDNEMFIAEQFGGNSTTGGFITDGGVRQETLQTGQIFNVFARAVGNDVFFKLNASISAKIDLIKKQDDKAGLYVESPKTTAMIFDSTQTLESGTTRIVSGINVETVNVADTDTGIGGSGVSKALGYAKTLETTTKETIMIVTARITRGLSYASKE